VSRYDRKVGIIHHSFLFTLLSLSQSNRGDLYQWPWRVENLLVYNTKSKSPEPTTRTGPKKIRKKIVQAPSITNFSLLSDFGLQSTENRLST
jgi:hypothetical protein